VTCWMKPTIFAHSSNSFLFSIIYGKEGVHYWSFSLLWWTTLELQHQTVGTANILIYKVTIGWTYYRRLNNQPYLRTETSYEEENCTHHCLPDQSRNSFVSIFIDVTRNNVCFNNKITIKRFNSTVSKISVCNFGLGYFTDTK